MPNEYRNLPYDGPYDIRRVEQSKFDREELLARIERDATLNLDFANNRYRVYEGLTDGDTLKPFNSALTYSRLSSATGFNRLKLLGTALDDQQRLVSDPETGESEGLLVEGEATNSLLHNRDLSNAVWQKGTAITVTKNITGIDGVADNAWTVEDTSTSIISTVWQGVTVEDNTATHAQAVYLAKTQNAATFPGYRLIFQGGTASAFYEWTINTDSGTAVNRDGRDNVGGAISISDSGRFWKVAISGANNGQGNTTLRFDLLPAVNSDASGAWSAITGSVVYDYGQVILNSTTVGSPILTGAEPATRAADLVSVGDVGKWRSAEALTLIFDFDSGLTQSNEDFGNAFDTPRGLTLTASMGSQASFISIGGRGGSVKLDARSTPDTILEVFSAPVTSSRARVVFSKARGESLAIFAVNGQSLTSTSVSINDTLDAVLATIEVALFGRLTTNRGDNFLTSRMLKIIPYALTESEAIEASKL